MTFRFCPLCAEPLAALTEGEDAGRPGCPRGHFVDYANPAVTAFAFLQRDGLWLVLQRAQDPYREEWDLPGGFVEGGESPVDCVRREVQEETALEALELRVVGAYVSRYGDTGKWTVDIAYAGRASAGDARLSGEKSDAAWVALEELPPLAFAGEREALAQLRRMLSAVTPTPGPDATYRA